MSRQLPATDVVIVGLGAAGGIAAHVFAEAGLKVVGLEAGPRLGVADYLAEYDELKGYTFENALGRFKANKEVPTWRPNADSPIAPPLAPIVMANGVGGSSVHYTGQSWRFRQDDFAVRSSTVEKYGESAIPAGAALADWPMTYDDLESFYGKVENLIGVSGAGGANPFESPRTADYPMPPLRRSGLMDLADQAMTTLGYDPFPQPAAVLSESYAGRPACSYCGYCSGYGCWNDSKSSTLVSSIVTAEATGNFEVRPNSRVMKIVSTEAGKVSGVEYLDENGETQVQPAALVVVATYVYENSRLLFLSTSDAYPNGLGNSAGQLGKYYSAHTYVSAAGYAPGKNFNALSGTGAQSTAMDNLNGDNFDHTGLGFIRGGIVNVSNGESTPIAASRNVPPSIAPWGSAYKAWLKDGLRSSLSALCQLEVLPYEGNFLDLDPEATDDLGMPRIRITYDIGENERVAGEYIRTRMEEILKEMGATETWSYGAAAMPVNSHAYGGTRMGSDPATSVVNQYGQAHDTANLVVLGGSTFPATTGYNPTETIEAHAWYAADYLAKNIGTIGA